MLLFILYNPFIKNMAKKSMIQREEKRKRLVKKYLDKRNGILKQLKQADSLDEIFALNQKNSKITKKQCT